MLKIFIKAYYVNVMVKNKAYLFINIRHILYNQRYTLKIFLLINFCTNGYQFFEDPDFTTPVYYLLHFIAIKCCVCYIFASLFCMSKRERKNVLSCFKSSFRSLDDQNAIFQIFKCHNVIKCQNMKQKTDFTQQLGKQTVW